MCPATQFPITMNTPGASFQRMTLVIPQSVLENGTALYPLRYPFKGAPLHFSL